MTHLNLRPLDLVHWRSLNSNFKWQLLRCPSSIVSLTISIVSFNVQLVNRPPNGSFTTGSFYQLYWQVIHQELLEGINQPVDLIVPSHPHFSPLSMPLTFGNRNHIMQFLTMVRRPWKVLPANCLKEMFKYL